MTARAVLVINMGVGPTLRNDRVGFVVFDTPRGAKATLSLGTSRRTLVDRARRLTDRYDAPVRDVRYIDAERLDEDYNALCRDALADLYAEVEAREAA